MHFLFNFKAFQDFKSHDATNRLPTTRAPPSGEYIKKFDMRGEKIKQKKVRERKQNQKKPHFILNMTTRIDFLFYTYVCSTTLSTFSMITVSSQIVSTYVHKILKSIFYKSTFAPRFLL